MEASFFAFDVVSSDNCKRAFYFFGNNLAIMLQNLTIMLHPHERIEGEARAISREHIKNLPNAEKIDALLEQVSPHTGSCLLTIITNPPL